jgi:glycosyltransferase involved in cell wall biosynthesis
MKLNWFSPLQTSASAIARYTQAVLPALAQHAEVTLWTNQAGWDPEVSHHAHVRRYDADRIAWADVNRADVSIYHMGNNPEAHAAIWGIAHQHPGIIVLHDISFHHLFAILFRQRRDCAAYLAVMERFYGRDGVAAAAEFWSGNLPLDHLAERYPLTELVIERSLGVLVHTRLAFAQLEPARLRPLAYAPLPYRLTAASPRREPARNEAVRRYRCVIFGHLHPNRRVDAILDALAEYAERQRFQLDIYGRLWDAGAIAAHIRRRGLSDLVRLHGFVSAAELDSALAAAHLAINLRHPTMGEASFTQLQIWDHALPSLVTRTGWYATLPEDTVAFVRPEHEVEDLHTHLNAFLAAPERFAAMGRRGHAQLQRDHTPAGYVHALLDLADSAIAYRPRAVTWELAARAGRTMRAWSWPSATDRLLHQVAEQIATLCGNGRRSA